MKLFETFVNPPRKYTLIPFWFLNDDLSEDELRRQIDDFEAHGVYGFVPHARIGLPETIAFMSERYLHFIRVCVEHAAKRDMVVVLYDEGMYPSGSCAGQVVAANPRHATRCVERSAPGPLGDDEELIAQDDRWMYVHRYSKGVIRGVHYLPDGKEFSPPSGDILNPEATASFFRLVLYHHYEVLKDHFGKTIIGMFTDEPGVLGRGGLPDIRPWTWNFETFLHDYLGYDFRPHLAALWEKEEPDAARFAVDFRRAVNARLEQAFYAPYSRWCANHGIALAGHPAGSDDIGVLKYFHVPGQDVVWRYIEPYKPSALEGEHSTMGKCSSSAQRHYRRARNSNECFGAFGWNLTYDEMRWVTNWLLVRGVNLLYPHAFYYSVRGPRHDERPPDVGPHNVWWAGYKTYADYCRRLCWLLSESVHVCHFAILGAPSTLPWRAAKVMFETQHDFNYLDSETVLTKCRIGADGIRIADMNYRALIVDGPDFVTRDILRALQPMINSGRVLPYLDPVPEIPALATTAENLVKLLDERAEPDVMVSPPPSHLRYIHLGKGRIHFYLFANEGPEEIDVSIQVSARGKHEWWDPESAAVLDEELPGRLRLPPISMRVLACKG
ncbi:MAG: hypothetical protein HY706_06105 [Candidatus Hydrogenedentes bacterium]|nr:hypothetical protein [Candidatus Hydrogenedentota bacterium]